MNNKYKILSLCGGGVRGIMSATILARLEASHPGFMSNIDLMAGTSTGSAIISLLLGNYTTKDLGKRLVEFIKHYQPAVKNHDPKRPMNNLHDFIDALTTIHNGNPPLSTFNQQVLMTSFQLGNVATGQHWDQFIMTNFDDDDTKQIGIVDATTASCCMNGMYAAHQFTYNNETIYAVDGAFASHDPTLIAIAYAMKYKNIPIEDIVVVDVGTGFMPHNFDGEAVKNWGCEQWVYAKNNDAVVPPLLANQPFSIPILDILLNGTNTTLVQQQANMMLPGRFVNLNPHIKDVSETDDAAVPYLIEQGLALNIDSAKELIKQYWPA